MSTPSAVPGASATLEPGYLLAGRYLVIAGVGRGGFGSVWRAHDELLNRDVAVKRVHGGQSPDVRERAHREGRVAACLHHPRLAAIYDIVELNGEVCLVMEYVPAPTLADVLAREGPLPPTRVAAIGAQIAEGLAAMHQSGIIHRDVKPANILVGPDDTVTVTDFGVAIGDAEPGRGGDLVAGTPQFMAPELARGAVPTAAADVFSLGATLYAALEGSSPPLEEGEPPADMVSRVAAGLARPTDHLGHLGATLRSLLDHEPRRRPPAATAARLLADHAAPGGVLGLGVPDDRKPENDGDHHFGLAPPARGSTTLALTNTEDLPSGVTPPRGVGADHVGGRHRAARWRPPRGAVPVGVVAGVLGGAAIVGLATESGPAPAGASPTVAPVAVVPPPTAGSPIVPTSPRASTSAPVEQVASSAAPQPVTPHRTPTRAASSRHHRPDISLEDRGDRNGGDGGFGGGDGGGGDGGGGDGGGDGGGSGDGGGDG